MAAYAQASFDLGGMPLRRNVVSSETLRDAVAHPERSGDLLLRISGYDASFVDLHPEPHQELMSRMAHPIWGGGLRPLARLCDTRGE